MNLGISIHKSLFLGIDPALVRMMKMKMMDGSIVRRLWIVPQNSTTRLAFLSLAALQFTALEHSVGWDDGIAWHCHRHRHRRIVSHTLTTCWFFSVADSCFIGGSLLCERNRYPAIQHGKREREGETEPLYMAFPLTAKIPCYRIGRLSFSLGVPTRSQHGGC